MRVSETVSRQIRNKNKGKNRYSFILLFTLLTLLTSVSPRIETVGEGVKYAPYDDLLKRINHNNYVMRGLVADDESTRNEVDNFDYYMDQKAVQRAWSRDKMKKHEEYMNTHFVKKAMENVNFVLKTAQCSIPTRRCLDVNRMEFGKPKNYWPNCAIVHKCGHDSGCCIDPEHVCSPVKTETIELFFFSIEHSTEKQTGRIELLTFENHTLCDCRPAPKNSVAIPTPRDCHCPKHFMPVPSSLDCRCDCDEKESKPCRRVKRGRRSYFYKGCRKGNCGLPACDFGEFKEEFGRCPRKSEKLKRRRK